MPELLLVCILRPHQPGVYELTWLSGDSSVELKHAILRSMGSAMAQVSGQALHVFHEYPTQKSVHCFLLVDKYYRHLRYDRSQVRQIGQEMDADEIMVLCSATQPTYLGEFSVALEEFQGFARLTEQFLADWKECTSVFMGQN